jgi:hypothetical protein
VMKATVKGKCIQAKSESLFLKNSPPVTKNGVEFGSNTRRMHETSLASACHCRAPTIGSLDAAEKQIRFLYHLWLTYRVAEIDISSVPVFSEPRKQHIPIYSTTISRMFMGLSRADLWHH